MYDAEVLIVGAGPAGATAALNLAPFRRVMLVERKATVAPRIGESLLPTARRLLADMGLLASFHAEGHAPWHGNRTVWGGGKPREIDFLRDPDGHGWHLDRARFEHWLRTVAQERGAELVSPATVQTLKHDGQQWHVGLQTATGPRVLTANVIIDAGGRSAPIAHKLGLRAQSRDKLLCSWLYGHDACNDQRGLSYVEAVCDGWWYTAPLPGQRRVLAFHTDADLPSAKGIREPNRLLTSARAVKELAAHVNRVGFMPQTMHGLIATQSCVLVPAAGEAWLAVGDAAIGFDPLASQGLLNALFTGLAGAEAVDSYLRGVADAFAMYTATIRGIADAYQRHLAFCYALEMRWPEEPFWQRRHTPAYGWTL